MTQTVHATYDGHVLRPEEPLDLAPNSKVTVTVHSRPVAGHDEPRYKFFRVAESLSLDLPPDASEHLHEYLYGAKRDGGQ